TAVRARRHACRHAPRSAADDRAGDLPGGLLPHQGAGDPAHLQRAARPLRRRRPRRPRCAPHAARVGTQDREPGRALRLRAARKDERAPLRRLRDATARRPQARPRRVLPLDPRHETWTQTLDASRLAAPLSYRTTRGEPQEHPLWWAVTHFFNPPNSPPRPVD